MSDSPAVSVICTVYNGERYLQEMIDSIRQQSLRDFEFVIVDDGSTDGTREILTRAQSDPRIKVIFEKRTGRAQALNIAWRNGRGPYVANIDADDLAAPNRLETQVRFLQENPDVGMVSSDCRFIYEDDGVTVSEKIGRPPVDDQALRQILVRACPIVHSTVMMPRHVLESLGGYNEAYTTAIDYELWIRIGTHYRLANIPQVLATRRMHANRHFAKRGESWTKMQSVMKLRWHAWQEFSGRPTELGYVFARPTARWLISKSKKLRVRRT